MDDDDWWTRSLPVQFRMHNQLMSCFYYATAKWMHMKVQSNATRSERERVSGREKKLKHISIKDLFNHLRFFFLIYCNLSTVNTKRLSGWVWIYLELLTEIIIESIVLQFFFFKILFCREFGRVKKPIRK